MFAWLPIAFSFMKNMCSLLGSGSRGSSGRNPSALSAAIPADSTEGTRGCIPWELDREMERGNLGWWSWRRRRRNTRKVPLGKEDLQGQPDVEQRPLITEESGPRLVLIQPWEQEKHVRKMKVAF